MRFINRLLLLFIIGTSHPVFSQESGHDADQNSVDSAAILRRERYEATLKYIAEIKRRREQDPERFADSVAQVKERKRYEEAIARIEGYQKSEELDELIELDLSGARLSEVPEWIYQAKKLEILVLDYNQITRLPKRLEELSALRRIYWRYNDLKGGVKVPALDGIEKIDFTGNSLARLPKVHRLKGLEELVLENNNFTKIPTWRGRRLKDLVELDLSLNPIELDKRWYGLLDHVSILKLNKCEINSLHPSFYKMEGLTELQIQVNQLDSLPEGISALANLTKLSFYKNKLTELPLDFYELKKLVVIDLYYNEFERLPTELGNFKELEILYLSFNKLFDIPAEIAQLKKLEELYIHHNRLSEIPGNLEQLGKLRTLHFQDNYIAQFPSHVLKMKSLRDLDISNTDIRSIPVGIAELKLKNFYWRNLDIDLNDPENSTTREGIMQLIKQGTNVIPAVSMQEISLD